MNSPVNPGEIFYAPSHISWVQDRACLLLVNEATQATAQLVGFPAALCFLQNTFAENASDALRKWIDSFMLSNVCKECNGARLKKESLHFKIYDKNIAQLSQLDITDLQAWFAEIHTHLNERQTAIYRNFERNK